MTRNQRVALGTAAGISTIHASASVALTLWPSQIVPIALGFVTSCLASTTLAALVLPHLRMLPVCLRKIVPTFFEVGAASGSTLRSS